MMGKIAIIGAGKWGQALAFALGRDQEVYITSRTKKELPNFIDLQKALQCEYLIITIPAQEINSWLKSNFVFTNQKVLVAAKRIEAATGKFLNEIYSQYIPKNHLGFLSGPSFATEVIKSLPTALVINSISRAFYNELSPFFPSFIKTYYSNDIIGAEIAGAYKNVLAIAGGICEGLALGYNAKAALMARGLLEMQRFGVFFHAQPETFIGLSGAGDLFLTANSHLSRNFRVGIGLANHKKLETILSEIGEVAEGIETAKAIQKLSKKNQIYTPIANEVVAILEGKNPSQSLQDLLKSQEK